MKNAHPLVHLVCLLLVSCSGPGQPHSHQKARPNNHDSTTTRSPSGRVAKLSESYNPNADSANKGGFSFQDPKPDDPAQAKKKPFSIEALYKVKYVGHPRWSPDGKQILFVVRSYDLAKGKSKADIYLIKADGTGLRRMTWHEALDFAPEWSPDGKSILFLSSRKEGVQVWIMRADGGEPRKVTDLPFGALAAQWAPDGHGVVVATKLFADLGADLTAQKKLKKDMDASPIKAHLADHLFYRHWTSWEDGKVCHLLYVPLDKDKRPRDLTPGPYDAPAFSLAGRAFDVSSDGEVAFDSNRAGLDARAWTTNKDLYVVAAKGGPMKNLTDANEAFDGVPHYGPKGRYLAFLRQEQPGYESDRFRLAVYDRKTGDVRVLTEGFDNWVEDFHWRPDGRSLVFQAPIKGRYPLFEVDLATGKIHRIPNIPSVRAFDVGPDGRIAFTNTSVARPTELFVAGPRGQSPKRLTFFNKALLATYDVRPAEEAWVPGAEGKPVHVFIVKPHGFKKGKKYPLVLNVHGGPQGQWSDSFRGDWQVYPGAGYVVAFPNPHGSTGYGQAYTAAISKDWGGKVYEDVMKVTDYLAKLPYVDENRMVAMGWSYGGYMMDWLAGHTTRFKAIATMMGVYDLATEYGATEELWFPEWDIGGTPWDNPKVYHKWSPSTYARNFRTPMLIITGEQDFRVPYTQSLRLFTMLRRRGIPARLIVFPNDGHWPSFVRSMPLYYAAHLDWFHRYAGGAASPYDLKAMIRGRAFENNTKKRPKK